MAERDWTVVTSPILIEDHSARHEDGGADEISLVGLSGDPANTVNKSDFDAKGDLITASADDTPVILPAGANSELLIPNSSLSSGLEWIALVTFEEEIVIHNGEAVYI